MASSVRGAALGDRHADGVELLGELAADADADRDPAARPGVEVGDLLGDDDRVVERQQQDRGADPDPLGPGGQQRQPGDGLAGRVPGQDVAALPDRLDRQALGRRQPAPLRLRERRGSQEDAFAWQRGSFVASGPDRPGAVKIASTRSAPAESASARERTLPSVRPCPTARHGRVSMAGPLAGMKVVELEGRGPGPFGAMVLADLGAEVVRLSRPDRRPPSPDEDPTERMIQGRRQIDLVLRGRRSVAVDLKHADGLATARRLVDQADVLIEGYRPGVAERLGLGPDVCLERNPGLVYARITGWGQDGPYAQTPGHDINYLALSGALDLLRRADEPPAPPLNLLGDYGGGGMLLVVGILGALFERSRSGRGQVVDAAMVDGVALLTTIFHGMMAEGLWPEVPGSHVLQLGGAVLQRVRDRRRQVRHRRRGRAAVLRAAGRAGWAPTSSHRNRAIRARGPTARSASRRSSRRRPATSGASSSTAPTPASRRCSR